ncbi:MAG: PorV/PorQ family protein [candidate division WOR-3 bacterium]|nr:PorV/PorQ family protein [candidate division WOR-3 bacterium]
MQKLKQNSFYWSWIGLVLFVLLGNCSLATHYAGDFQSFGASARALGLGGAYVACVNDASAIYYNPSCGVLLDSRQILFLHSKIFSGIIQHNFLSFIASQSRNQAFGGAVLFNRIPDIKITKLPDANQPPSEYNRPEIDRTINAADWTFYLNYARMIINNFHLGTNFKFFYRNLGIGTGWGIGLDFGATRLLPQEWQLGLRITDITHSLIFWNNKTREIIVPHLAFGFSKTFNLNNSNILLSSELEGDMDKLNFNTNLGAEYVYKNTLAFRLGFYHQNFTVGLGLNYKKIFVDYAYVKEYYQEDLGASQKFSGGIRF